jgi:hypothetical protein
MSTKPLSEKELYESYRTYEANVERQVKSGLLPSEAAQKLLKLARKNYSRQSYNRELSKCG